MHDALARMPPRLQDLPRPKDKPDWTAPMLASLSHHCFSDPDWIFERKLDGERCLLHKEGGNVILFSRNQKKKNATYPEIAKAVQKLPDDVVLDGEIVTFTGDQTNFTQLQRRIHVQQPDDELLKQVPVTCYIFDILYLDGYDLYDVPLRERKNILRRGFTLQEPLRRLAYRKEQGESFLAQACTKGWEGILAKKANGPYIHGRSRDWLKFKCENSQEFIIVGATRPQGERIGFGALLLGYFERGALCYAGKVGTGFDEAFLRKFAKKLAQIEQKQCPLADFDESENDVNWVKPVYVAEVAFTEWPEGGKLRHPRFRGLRDDKDVNDVVREDP